MNRNDIKKYLEGNTTGAESEQVRNWIKNSENDPAFREIMGEIWANSQLNLVGEEPDFEQMLSSIHHRINSQPINFRNAPTKKKPAPFFNWFSKVAAILVLPLLLTSIYLYFNPMQKANQVASASLHEIYTKPGTRTKIELPDGTLV